MSLLTPWEKQAKPQWETSIVGSSWRWALPPFSSLHWSDLSKMSKWSRNGTSAAMQISFGYLWMTFKSFDPRSWQASPQASPQARKENLREHTTAWQHFAAHCLPALARPFVNNDSMWTTFYPFNTELIISDFAIFLRFSSLLCSFSALVQ